MTRPRRIPIYLAFVAVLLPWSAGAQSVLDRTPNLSGGWVGTGGNAYFNFVHRFSSSGGKVTNYPAFLLGYSVNQLFLVGAHFTTFSRIVEADFNEWELFTRFAPLPPAQGLPFDLSLTAAYNTAAESVDGELTLGVPLLDRVTLMGSLRGFSKGLGTDDARMAVGGGIRLRISDNVGISGDVVTPLELRDGEAIGWGVGLQLAIPGTPHTLSLQATNTNSSSLQGSSVRTPLGRTGTRWGFEFTVPITLARYFGGGGDAEDVTITADTVRVPIVDFEFGIQRLVVRPGTTIVWVNEGDVGHTSTADDGAWRSPTLLSGESYSRVFNEPGEYAYHCEPHPFMTAVVVVQESPG